MFTYVVEKQEDSTIFSFDGDLTYSYSLVSSGLVHKILDMEGEKSIVFDFSNLHFLDSNGIMFLLLIKKECIGKDINLKIVNARNKVKRVLSSFNLTDILNIQYQC